MSLATASLVPGVLIFAVAALAVWFWRRVSGAEARWFWIGASLWALAVLAKAVIALFTNAIVIGALKSHFSYPLYLLTGGAYLGIQSSACEIGLTLVAGLRWRELGRDAGRAIAVGVGAGAFEAVLLGIASLVGAIVWLAKLPGTEAVGQQLQTLAATTPLFWLLAPAERLTAIICHAGSRGLVLVGTRQGRAGLVALGFLIFALLDGVAGASQLSGKLGVISLWWFELAFSVFAFMSLPLLFWLMHRYGDARQAENGPANDPPVIIEQG
jgi:hypothetical protein